MIISTLRNERRVTLAELAKRIQKREVDARNTVEWLVELGMAEGIGNGNSRRYMLSSKVYALSGNETGYTRQRGMTTIQEMGMIDRHIDKFGRITRADTAELCKCDSNHAYYLLSKMVDENRIVAIKQGKNSYYIHKLPNKR